MTEPDIPIIGEAAEGALVGTHAIQVDPWPDLRWIHLGGQRIAVHPAPVADLEAIKEQVAEALSEMPDRPMAWAEVLDVVLAAAGVPGLLAEIDRLVTPEVDRYRAAVETFDAHASRERHEEDS